MLRVSEFTSDNVASDQAGSACAVSDVQLTFMLRVREFTSANVASGQAGSACAVSDVQLTFMLRVNEFTSDNVARVQRHDASCHACCDDSHLVNFVSVAAS